jgi:hypothetical protein
MSRKRTALVKEATRATLRPHQPGQAAFRAILAEESTGNRSLHFRLRRVSRWLLVSLFKTAFIQSGSKCPAA